MTVLGLRVKRPGARSRLPSASPDFVRRLKGKRRTPAR